MSRQGGNKADVLEVILREEPTLEDVERSVNMEQELVAWAGAELPKLVMRSDGRWRRTNN